MRTLSWLWWSLLVAWLPAQSEKAAAVTDRKDGTPSDFARFVKVADGGHLDVAVTSYRNPQGVVVRLFGAVHIADAGHYRELQRRFAACDALLYELVAPADYRPQPGEARPGNPVSMLQTAMKSALELSFQLDAVDYRAANFVHADMSPQEFQAAMQAKGESLMSLLWRAMVNGMKTAGEMAGNADLPKLDLVTAFRSGEGRHLLRMWLGQQLEDIEKVAAGFGDGANGSVLVEGRNGKCFEVLQRELAAGKKQLGIYYGAAHLPDMEQRLLRLGFAKFDHEWLVAWDCSKRPDPKFDRQAADKRAAVKTRLAALLAAGQAWQRAHDGRLPAIGDLDGEPRLDPWGHDYVFRSKDPEHLEVVSAGPDGKLDTEDDLSTDPFAGFRF